jgi:predicted transcriptional regulator
MRTIILGVETQGDLTRRILATARGQRKAGDDRISFESVGDLWRVLAPKRMEIVRVITGAGPLTIREVARRVDRDFKRVHSDVTLLLDAGFWSERKVGAWNFPMTACMSSST